MALPKPADRGTHPPRRARRSLRERVQKRAFGALLKSNLLFNTCWEDPAVDRVALDLKPTDRVVVITSAGCNALDYVLAGAGAVNCVDLNPAQNALLELKRAAITGLNQTEFFELFGRGRSERARDMYGDALRPRLPPGAQDYWDRNVRFFEGRGWRNSFYYRGASGLFARLAVSAARRVKGLDEALEALLAATNIPEQRAIYRFGIRDRLWKPWLTWMLSRPTTLQLAGVPWPQYAQIQAQYPGGVARHIRDAFEAVVTRLPFQDNYFWRLYIQGGYTSECCPEYLKPANFERLKGGLIDRISIATTTVTDFLRANPGPYDKFVLLDHMDWMGWRQPDALREEWREILAAARPGARVIFRSGGLSVPFVDALQIPWRGRPTRLDSLLRYHRELAADLHARDRVHTYGSFYIADLPEPA